MRVETIKHYCDFCEKEYDERDLSTYMLPLKDKVAEAHGTHTPQTQKSQKEICKHCAVKIANFIEKNVKTTKEE